MSGGLCKLYGHRWRYNFPKNSMPNKAICKRCKIEAQLNLKTLEWEITKTAKKS